MSARHSQSLGTGVTLALGAALLFGASTPFAKVLVGRADPILVAGLLYAGSGLGLAAWSWIASRRTSSGWYVQKW